MAKKNASNVTGKQLLELLEAQDYKCALTSRELTPDSASLDHKIPLAKGGSHTIENLWIVHEDVNRAKSTFTESEFVAICQEVADMASKKVLGKS